MRLEGLGSIKSLRTTALDGLRCFKNFYKVFKIGSVIVPRLKVQFTLLGLLLCYSYFNTSFCCGTKLVEMQAYSDSFLLSAP